MKKLNKKNKIFLVQLKYITILNSICDTAPNTKIQIIIFIITEIECWPVFKQDPLIYTFISPYISCFACICLAIVTKPLPWFGRSGCHEERGLRSQGPAPGPLRGTRTLPSEHWQKHMHGNNKCKMTGKQKHQDK